MRAKSFDDVLLAYHGALRARDEAADNLQRCAKATARWQTELTERLRIARELRAEVIALGADESKVAA